MVYACITVTGSPTACPSHGFIKTLGKTAVTTRTTCLKLKGLSEAKTEDLSTCMAHLKMATRNFVDKFVLAALDLAQCSDIYSLNHSCLKDQTV